MRLPESHIMSQCNKRGIRIYPIRHAWHYYVIEIEINKTAAFLHKDIKRIITDKKIYDVKKTKWVDKIHELYKYFYDKYVS